MTFDMPRYVPTTAAKVLKDFEDKQVAKRNAEARANLTKSIIAFAVIGVVTVASIVVAVKATFED